MRITAIGRRGNASGVYWFKTARENDIRHMDELFAKVEAWEKEKGDERMLSLDVSLYYPPKSYDQLALLFPLCRILAMEQNDEFDETDVHRIYLGLIAKYGEPQTVEWEDDDGDHHVERYMPGASSMNTVQVSRLIEGAFRELYRAGVELESSKQITNYYIEWRQWRGKLKHDGLEDTYQSVEDYRRRVPFCEACLLRAGEHMAHIISKGAGGENFETWNFLHLCTVCHLSTQHTKGWIELLGKYPHLIGKVNVARERLGLPVLKAPEDMADDLFPESTGG